jgi:hypothetical protein
VFKGETTMRKLTKYFGTYSIAKYEKATGKGVMDLLDIGNFEVNKLANIIMLGNKDFKSEEEAYDRLDEYLKSDEDNSLITAYFDLIDELDKDIKLMKSCGIKVDELKAEFKNMANQMGDKFKENMTELKDKKDNDGSNDTDNKIVELPVDK